MSKKNKNKKLSSEAEVKKNDIQETEKAVDDTAAIEDAVSEETVESLNVTESETAEKSEKETEVPKKKSDVGYYLRIAGVLTLICSFVALMLSLVNMMTHDRIEELEAAQKKEAVAEIFGEIDDALLYDGYTGDEEVYLAVKEGKLFGYCISVVSQGYGGEISMMVGIDSAGDVVGVKIISMSETAGVGSKTKNDSFLDQYKGEKGPFTVGDNVDGISGATISSKAVTAGVNSAVSANVDLRAAASSVGLEVWGADADTGSEETASDTDSETAAEAESTTANVAQSPVIPGMEKEETHIDPASAGQYQSPNYYESDTAYTYSRDTGYFLQRETTDTEPEDSAVE